jgi:hypothetical protein
VNGEWFVGKLISIYIVFDLKTKAASCNDEAAFVVLLCFD